jgi:hypothetical protein
LDAREDAARLANRSCFPYAFRVGEEALRVLATARAWPEKLWLRLPPGKLHWFDAESERRLIPAAEPR